jgi:hypothetical protein
MNAYELAKQMLDVTDCETSEYYQAGMMLKQQADRINVLEANYKIQLNIVGKQQDYIDQLEQGLRASINLNKAQAERAQEK